MVVATDSFPPKIAPHATAPQNDFWSKELLFRLDWSLFQKLTISLVEKGGYKARLIKTGPGGESLYSVLGGLIKRPQVYVGFSAWRTPKVPVDDVKALYSRIIHDDIPKGVYLSAGTFADEVYEFAHGRMLELIDAEKLLTTLRRLPIRERDRLLHDMTLGDFTSPTCPSCGAKMILRDTAAPEVDGKLENLRIRESAVFDRDVRVDQMIVEKSAEVVFEKYAHAKRMTIRGKVTGDLVCQGPVDIQAGGVVIGSVAARSISLLPGGVIDGDMKILNEEKIAPAREREVESVWGCRNYPKCKAVLD